MDFKFHQKYIRCDNNNNKKKNKEWEELINPWTKNKGSFQNPESKWTQLTFLVKGQSLQEIKGIMIKTNKDTYL